jgi:hypothetical protein
MLEKPTGNFAVTWEDGVVCEDNQSRRYTLPNKQSESIINLYWLSQSRSHFGWCSERVYKLVLSDASNQSIDCVDSTSSILLAQTKIIIAQVEFSLCNLIYECLKERLDHNNIRRLSTATPLLIREKDRSMMSKLG